MPGWISAPVVIALHKPEANPRAGSEKLVA